MLSNQAVHQLHHHLVSKGYSGSLSDLKKALDKSRSLSGTYQRASNESRKMKAENMMGEDKYPWGADRIVIWFGDHTDVNPKGFPEPLLPSPGKVINKAYFPNSELLSSVVLLPSTLKDINDIRKKSEKLGTMAWIRNGEKYVSLWYSGKHTH